jgi:stromal membrane-associated protein
MSNQKSNSKEQEARHRKALQELLKLPENRECADCTAKSVHWASVNLGVFNCIKCAGIHRNLGVHISKVRSVTLDKWTDEQIETMQRIGNARAKEIYEANGAPPKPSEDDDVSVIERYIRNKYEKKMWMVKDANLSTPLKKQHSTPDGIDDDDDEVAEDTEVHRHSTRTPTKYEQQRQTHSRQQTSSTLPQKSNGNTATPAKQAPQLFSFDDDIPATNTTTAATLTPSSARGNVNNNNFQSPSFSQPSAAAASNTNSNTMNNNVADFFSANQKRDDILAMFDAPVQPSPVAFNRGPMMNNAVPMSGGNVAPLNRGPYPNPTYPSSPAMQQQLPQQQQYPPFMQQQQQQSMMGISPRFGPAPMMPPMGGPMNNMGYMNYPPANINVGYMNYPAMNNGPMMAPQGRMNNGMMVNAMSQPMTPNQMNRNSPAMQYTGNQARQF